MPEMSGPWEVPTDPAAVLVGDQTREGLGESDWRRLMRATSDGVLVGSGAIGQPPLEVYATGNDRNVRVRPGRALIQGALYQGTARAGTDYVAQFLVPAPGAATSQVYRVVLTYNPTAKTVRLELRGAANSSVILQVEDGTWQIPLATIAVTSGSVTMDQITDDRRPRGDLVRQLRSHTHPVGGSGGTAATIPNTGVFTVFSGWESIPGDLGFPRDRDTDGIDYSAGVYTLKADGLYTATMSLTFTAVNTGWRAAAFLDENNLVLARTYASAATTGQSLQSVTVVMTPRYFTAGSQVKLAGAVQNTAAAPVPLLAVAGVNLVSIQRLGSPR